jgi:hypothetical protein
VHQQGAVAGEQRVRHHLVAHVAPVDVGEDLALAREGHLGIADPTVHRAAAALVVEAEQRLGALGAQHLSHPLGVVLDGAVIE